MHHVPNRRTAGFRNVLEHPKGIFVILKTIDETLDVIAIEDARRSGHRAAPSLLEPATSGAKIAARRGRGEEGLKDASR